MPDIIVDASDLKNLAKRLEKAPRMMNAAAASALNRTLTFIGAETKRQVQQEYAVKKSISKSVKMTRASAGNLVATATYTDKPLPVFVFKFKGASNVYRSPVTVTIKQGGAKTHTGSNPAMFVGYGKPMIRQSGSKNIKTAYTVSIPQMVSNPEVYNIIAKKAEQMLLKRMEHEVDWRLSQL